MKPDQCVSFGLNSFSGITKLAHFDLPYIATVTYAAQVNLGPYDFHDAKN